MTIDFPTILVLATFLTGAVWAADALFFAKRREADGTQAAAKETGQACDSAKEPLVMEYSRSFFPILLLVLVIRSFVAEPFRIPSGSMMPTLLIGDFILVNKFAYGIRLPVIDKKIIDLGAPQRGDIAVFRYPEDPKVDFIKRIVGVPGDHVVYKDKALYINGKKAEQQPAGVFSASGAGSGMNGAKIFTETLGELEHSILIMDQPSLYKEFIVPEGQYVAIGDNRDNSRDSRYWGTVPDENLVGKAFFVWMSWDWDTKGFVNWSRIGSSVK